MNDGEPTLKPDFHVLLILSPIDTLSFFSRFELSPWLPDSMLCVIWLNAEAGVGS
jgi:hypothetical protein